MLKNEFSDFAYYTLDDFDTIELLKTDPMFIFDKHDFIVIDEAQKMPEIFNTIKIVADNYKNKRVIISGSSNMLLMKNISESLCGRAAYFELLPMTLGEKKDITNPTNLSHLLNNTIKEETINELEVSIYELLIRGFMPENMLSNDLVSISVWMESYIKTYLERDLRQLSQIESLIDFRRLKKVLALRVGNILNQAEIARETGISTATTYRYIKLLEVSNIIELLGSFFTNRIKRVVKSPKVFFIEPALAVFLSGYYSPDSLVNARELDGLFENMVFLHLKSLCEGLIPKANLYYFRSTTNKEVDFIIEYGRAILPIEVKLTNNPSIKYAKHLLYFLERYPEIKIGVIAYLGNQVKWLTSKVVAVPWWWMDY
ncbi:ATP-binding protein [Desulfothermus okinawensis JCM 13304]